MRIGLTGYTNKNSGIGLFIYELNKYLDADSILSIGSVKGLQEVWSEKQVTSDRPPSDPVLTTYFGRFLPEVIMFIETPFSNNLFSIAKRHGCKTVGIAMHETFWIENLRLADLIICPSFCAFEKCKSNNKKLLFLPIGLELFPFKERTGHTFLMNIGYGGPHDRRQAGTVIKAFTLLQDPSARMIVNSQVNFPGRIQDSRIEYRLQNFPEPKDCYSDGDIALFTSAYGGYERCILESMSSGMPCLTVNADPMNLFQHDKDFLMEPVSFERLTDNWVENCVYNAISVEDTKEKLEWLLTIDTKKYSHRARKQAEAQSWESTVVDYKGLWSETLEGLCSG